MIDDRGAYFCQPVNVCLPRPEIAPFDGVIEKAIHAVAIVLVVLGGIDSALGRDAVRPARAVLIAEALHVVTLFSQGGGGRSPGEARAHDNNFKLPSIRRRDETDVVLVARPLFRERSGRDL
jgi:hypothetical protein